MNEENYWFSVNQFASLDKRYKGAKDGGWVYAFRNPNHKQMVFKIGETARPPFQRLQELSSTTGVPIPYQAVYFIAVRQRKAAERYVHGLLDQYRVSQNKEFFLAPLRDVLAAMDKAVAIYSDMLLRQPFESEIIVCKSCQAQNRVRQTGLTVRIRCGECGAYL